jgi:hypothetical protein
LLIDFKKNKFSLLAVILASSWALYVGVEDKRWKNEGIIQSDAINYYEYLPAFFIHHDLTLQFVDSLDYYHEHGKYYHVITKDGKYVDKMTMGVALLVSPFFIAGHTISQLTKETDTGFSPVYEFFIFLAAIFYFFIGLFFLRKTLLWLEFSDAVSALTLLSIGLATNLLHYASNDAGMSHVYSFAIISVFIFRSFKWNESPTLRTSAFLGVVGGFATLIRPTNIIVFIIPLLLNVISTESLKRKLFFLKKNIKHIFIIITGAFLILLPQLIYWKYASGNWLFYSYDDQRFYFSHPHVLRGLFGFRNGLFVYSPILILIFPGILISYLQKKSFAILLPVFLLINSYIIYSWWCWWYGGSLGSRPMIDTYALLALPLSVCYSFLWQKGNLLKLLLATLIAAACWLSHLQITQFRKGILRWDGMTARAYFAILGKMSFPENYPLLIEPSDDEQAIKGLPERQIMDEVYLSLPALDSSYGGIKTSSGKFICGETGMGIVTANRLYMNAWETFLLIRHPGNVYTIKTFENKFVRVAGSPSRNLYIDTLTNLKEQLFKKIELGTNRFALKTYNGTYVSVSSDSLASIVYGPEKISLAETFEWCLKN